MKRIILCGLAGLAAWTTCTEAALVGHWTFDEPGLSNGNAVAAAVGSGGTFASGGDSDLHTITGVSDNAVSLDGNDTVDLSANSAALSSLTAGTIAFWFKTTAGFGTFVSASDSSDASSEIRVFMVSAGGSIGYESRNDGTTLFREYSSVGGYNDGEWHHAAAVSTGSDIQLYIDGNLQANEQISGSGFFADVDDLDTLLVGANDDSAAGVEWPYTGAIDDLRVYDHALTAAEVAALAVILRAHWTFDETSLFDGDPVAATVGADGVFESGGDTDSHATIGVLSRGVMLDGNDYVNLSAAVGALAGLQTGSIAFWFKAPDAAATVAFLSASDASDASSELRVFFYNANGWLAYAARNDGTTLFQQLSNTSGWDDDAWHHVTAVSTPSDVLLYVNGELQTGTVGHTVGTGFLGAVAGIDTLLVGANDDSAAGVEWSYTGAIDDLRIYQGTVSETLIESLATRPRGSIVILR
jgi:hypothetical protein